MLVARKSNTIGKNRRHHHHGDAAGRRNQVGNLNWYLRLSARATFLRHPSEASVSEFQSGKMPFNRAWSQFLIFVTNWTEMSIRAPAFYGLRLHLARLFRGFCDARASSIHQFLNPHFSRVQKQTRSSSELNLSYFYLLKPEVRLVCSCIISTEKLTSHRH